LLVSWVVVYVLILMRCSWLLVRVFPDGTECMPSRKAKWEETIFLCVFIQTIHRDYFLLYLFQS
jgi:hypothetical protein